ncbi:MAG: hypothetical protein LBU11_05715 [Zoogloeaceae bacterium]|jgi:hypothetical protein|nr:hypothetical protein [Zoogloeaceae bacterium]
MSRLLAFVVAVFGHGLVFGSAVAVDRTCTPDISWSDAPAKIRAQITKAAGGAVSPQDGPFNSTDVISDATPQARFFGACRRAELWTIAIERGGRGYHLQLFGFSGNTLTDKWTAFVPSGGFTPAILDRPHER